MPHGACARCTYGILDLPVHPLNHPIALRVVSNEAAVSMCLMPWLVQEPVHKAEVNCAPLSDVTVAGTPKCAFQLVMKVSVHMLASMLCRGTASTYLVDLLMMVNRYTWPSEGLPGELVCGQRDGVERSCRLLVELSTLSLLTVSAHGCQDLVHPLSHEMCSYYAVGGTYARVGHTVNGVENGRSVCQWFQWPGAATCHITQQASPLYLDSPHCQGGGLSGLQCVLGQLT